MQWLHGVYPECTYRIQPIAQCRFFRKRLSSPYFYFSFFPQFEPFDGSTVTCNECSVLVVIDSMKSFMVLQHILLLIFQILIYMPSCNYTNTIVSLNCFKVLPSTTVDNEACISSVPDPVTILWRRINFTLFLIRCRIRVSKTIDILQSQWQKDPTTTVT